MRPLFIDIETVAEFETLPQEQEKLYQYKLRDRNTGELPTLFEAKLTYERKAALSPITGKIVCITLGFLNGKELILTALTGDEEHIIKEFYRITRADYAIVIFNKQFDIPFIRVRALKHRISVPTYLDDAFCKPWDVGMEPRAKVKVYDVMDAIKGIGYNNFSLDEVCHILGVKSPKDGIGGAEVSSEYYKGNLDKIVEYCNKDVFALSQCYYVLHGENTDYTMTVREPEKPKVYTDSITETFETGESTLVEIDTAKLKTKKDKEIFTELLNAAKNVED